LTTRKLIAPLLAILLCSAAICSAQTQTVDRGPTTVAGQRSAVIKEQLPNGEFIVVIDGVEQRTITQEHAEQIKQRKEDLDRCQRARAVIDQLVAKQDQEIALLKKDRELADAQVALERERAGRIESMYNSEYALRLKAEQLNNAHGRVGKFFDNPLVQIGFKAVVPTVTMVRAFKN
jgi:hypothetical protein